jgi:hypothetical protein
MYVSTSKVTRLERKLGKEYLTRYEFLKQKFTEAGLNALNLHHPYFNDHGIGHIQRVISNLNAMINEKIFKTINPTEAYILLCCAWLHDIGMAFDHWKGRKLFHDEIRELHSEIARDFILNHFELFGIPKGLEKTIADIVYCHPRRKKLESILKEREKLLTDSVRSQFLAAIFRIADATDTDVRRAPEFKSKYVLSLPLVDQRHWKVCQLITGVRYDINEGKIMIDAIFKNIKDKQLIIWKLNDLYDELERVMHLLSKYGLPYVDITGNLTNYHTNKTEIIHARNIKSLGEELKAKENAYIASLYEELHKCWINDALDLKEKITLSRKIFKKLFWKHSYFEFYETDSKYDSLKRIYALQEHNIWYLQNGISRVEMFFKIVNISYSLIQNCYVTIQGVIPVYENKNLNLKIYDAFGAELPFSFIKDTFNEKVLKIDTPILSPGKSYAFKVIYDWPYPIETGGRRRWYSVPLYCFTSRLKICIHLPLEFQPFDIEVREEEPYPLLGEEIIDKIFPILNDENYIIHWYQNVCDARKIYKIYFSTLM